MNHPRQWISLELHSCPPLSLVPCQLLRPLPLGAIDASPQTPPSLAPSSSVCPMLTTEHDLQAEARLRLAVPRGVSCCPPEGDP